VVSHTDSLAIDIDRLAQGKGEKRGKQPRNTGALHFRAKESLRLAGTSQEMTMRQERNESDGDEEKRGERST
jgi:hypothetical protein